MKRLGLCIVIAVSSLMACGGNRARPDRVVSSSASVPSQPDPAATGAAVEAAHDGIVAASAHAMDRAVGWRALPPDLPWREILDPRRGPEGSLSAGTVADGVLLNGVELPQTGAHHSIIERHRRHRTRWATQEMVSLLQQASRYVHEAEGGAVLRVGNMSTRKGGDIRWSRSHNSGRDADLAFYVLEVESGASVPAPDLLRFDDLGIPAKRPDLKFDVVRNWKLTEALLGQTDVNVQWLFISLALKEMLLSHARSIGASDEIIRRAEQVLHQPTDAPPHADHFHLRIGCSVDDRIDGCVDYGPRWDWLDWHRDALLARAVAVSTAFSQGKKRDRERALEFMRTASSPFASDVAAVWGFWDDSEEVRELALQIASDQYVWSANALVQVEKLILSGGDRRKLARAYSILRRSRDPMARDFALSRLQDTEVDPFERSYAAGALAHFMEPELVPALVSLLSDPHDEVRNATGRVLRRITNRDDGVDWSACKGSCAAKASSEWRRWLETEGGTREAWVAAGFRALGVDIESSLQPVHIDALVPLLRSEEDYVRYNANRAIKELTGRWAPLEQDNGDALHKYWDKWWKKNRERVISGEIGPKS